VTDVSEILDCAWFRALENTIINFRKDFVLLSFVVQDKRFCIFCCSKIVRKKTFQMKTYNKIVIFELFKPWHIARVFIK